MNLHPLLVHFPIALLTFYALFELLRFRKLLSDPNWFFIKAAFVILGSVSSAATFLSGYVIKGGFETTPAITRLVETHQAYALATCLVFGLIACVYAMKIMKRGESFTNMMLKPAVILPLALIGLGLVTITGGLGGAIVYGPDIDPFVKFIYQVLIAK